MPYDLETPERHLKQLAGKAPHGLTGWHLALEALALHLYASAGWRGRLVLWLIGRIARQEARS